MGFRSKARSYSTFCLPSLSPFLFFFLKNFLFLFLSLFYDIKSGHSPWHPPSLFPCNTSASYIPAIEFAGESFQINPLDFSIGAVSEDDIEMLALGDAAVARELRAAAIDFSGMCISGLAGGDLSTTENLYVVGDTFIKNWYTVMSYTASDGEPAVLFAPSIGQ